MAGLDEEAEDIGDEEILGFIELSAVDVCSPCGPDVHSSCTMLASLAPHLHGVDGCASTTIYSVSDVTSNNDKAPKIPNVSNGISRDSPRPSITYLLSHRLPARTTSTYLALKNKNK